MKNISTLLYALLMTSAVLCLSSCGSDEPEGTEVEQIEAYLANNGLTAQKTASGIYYIINEPGSAEKPVATSQVLVTYKGYFLNDEEFDSNSEISFSLQQVIAGWTEGITLFGRGGSGSLFIPSNLAYGRNGRGGIGPNTPLAFDITLIDFQ